MSTYSENNKLPNWGAEKLYKRAVRDIEELNEAGEIDDISNFANRAAYFVSGSNDKVLPPHNQEAARSTLEHFGMTMTEFETRSDGHGFNKSYV